MEQPILYGLRAATSAFSSTLGLLTSSQCPFLSSLYYSFHRRAMIAPIMHNHGALLLVSFGLNFCVKE